MRKRLIGGVTAICIAFILVCNMFITASASVTAAALSVGVSLLLGALLNQMTGGQGYDFTDAFQDAVTVYPNLAENFENSEVYPIEKIEIDQSKVDIPDDYRFSTFGGTSADKTLIEIEKAINEGLESGSIEVNVDEQGNVSMPTTSWCNSVTDIYDRLGVVTSKNGTSRSRHTWVLASQYIDRVYYDNSFTFVPYVDFPDVRNYYSSYFLPFVITKDGDLLFFKLGYQFSSNSYWKTSTFACRYGDSFGNTLFDNQVNVGSESNLPLLFHTFSISSDLKSLSLDIDGAFSSSQFSPVHEVFDLPSGISDIGISGKLLSSLVTSDIDSLGWVYVNNYSKFEQAVQQGEIEKNEQVTSIPLTGVENTIENMGLAGIGSGATAGTVSVNSTTKEIVVTNEVTQEAEKVIEQPKVSDIDLPDSDTIIDKFPFSLPFDIYRLLTIFVADEKEPIFEVPIQTSFGWSGINVNVDESFTLDFTQFRINGIDIVQCLVRTSFNVLFIAFLIKITSKMIHK